MEEADAVHHRILEMQNKRPSSFMIHPPSEGDTNSSSISIGDQDKPIKGNANGILNLHDQKDTGTTGSMRRRDQDNSTDNDEVEIIIPPSSPGTSSSSLSPSPCRGGGGRGGGGGDEGKEGEDKFGFDGVFFRRFLRLHSLMFLSGSSLATILFIFLLIMSLLQEFIVYKVGLIASGFYKVLAEKDLPAFKIHLFYAVMIILAVASVKSINQYIQKVLTVAWRQLICRAVHRIYFSDIRYYQLNVLDKSIDNPDQRMTQDIDKFCTTYGEVLPKLMISPFVTCYYCYQAYQRSGWQGPLGCFIFFLISTIINKIIMTPIVEYVVKQERMEGDFRFMHTLIRVNSESIAFHNASNVEADRTNAILDRLIKTQHILYFRQFFLNFAVNMFDYCGSILSYLMLAIPIFSGKYDDLTPADLSALISQNAFVLIYLIYCFSQLIDMSGKFADIAGVVHRISQLIEKLNVLGDFWKDFFPEDDNKRTTSSEDLFDEWMARRRGNRGGENVDRDLLDRTQDRKSSRLLPAIHLQNVTFSPPMSTSILISDLTVAFSAGESVLIAGHSSAGKSSLLRILRGLWPTTSGRIQKYYPPGPQAIFYSPQKPYLTTGSLREQIYFPLKPSEFGMDDDNLITHYFGILKMLPLIERVGGLDVPVPWNVYDSLSPGEMQRICFVRIFFHRPLIAILDEATSALPLEMERIIYSECQRLGITTISVGHRASLMQYHDKLLTISSKGKWTLEPIVPKRGSYSKAQGDDNS